MALFIGRAPLIVEFGDASETGFDFRVEAAGGEAVIILRQGSAFLAELGHFAVGGFDLGLDFVAFHFFFLLSALLGRSLYLPPLYA